MFLFIYFLVDHEESKANRNLESTKTQNRVLIPNTYLVEFDQNSGVRNFQQTIVEFLQKSYGLPRSAIQMRQSIFSSLFYGASFSIDSIHSIGMIKSIPGVIAVHPVYSIPGPEPLTEYIQSKSRNNDRAAPVIAHDLTGVENVHNQLKNFGNGVRVNKDTIV